MYFVVFCEDWCSTVPENWIFIEEKVVKWPPKNDNVTAACKKNIKPNNNWLTKKYTRLFGPYKTYDTAREIEIATVNISTSDEASFIKESQTNEELPKRSRKLPVRYHQSSDNSSTNSTDDLEEINEKKTGSTTMKNFGFVPTDSNNIIIEDDLLDTQPLDYADFFENQDNNSQKEDNRRRKPSVINVEVLDIPYKSSEIITLKQNRIQEDNASSCAAPQKSPEINVNNNIQSIAPCSQGCCY
ncbi:uncharacterized protein LOC123296576 [Chrysoperla carnea]|uniref:uncharacterized protein LOC123296575 n=1 Tax=Chrysoperla carnea TaxID=189513 RepID=UPI001D08C2CB|nr:uncharacterized protein LOC123296575 [Chrysoperla carnea]XP_044734041.1 uncharacterized protein LOC123296576 [Chrysoperla carnea]